MVTGPPSPPLRITPTATSGYNIQEDGHSGDWERENGKERYKERKRNSELEIERDRAIEKERVIIKNATTSFGAEI